MALLADHSLLQGIILMKPAAYGMIKQRADSIRLRSVQYTYAAPGMCLTAGLMI